MKKEIRTDACFKPMGAFSQGIRAGDFVYVMGAGALDPQTNELRGESIEDQTRLTLENIQAVFEAAGGSMNDVVKVTVYLKDLDDWGRYDTTYAEFFPDPKPARATVGAGNLLFGMLIEIEAVAYIPQK